MGWSENWKPSSHAAYTLPNIAPRPAKIRPTWWVDAEPKSELQETARADRNETRVSLNRTPVESSRVGRICRNIYALFDFVPRHPDEIYFKAGDRIEVVEKGDVFGDG